MSKQTILDNSTTWGDEASKLNANFTELYNGVLPYSTGTFTPAITFGITSDAGLSVQQGTWAKVGNLVFINYLIQWATLGSSDGDMKVSNLPFISDDDMAGSYPEAVGQTTITGVNSAFNTIFSTISGGNSYLDISGTQDDGAGKNYPYNVVKTDLASSGSISGSIVYRST